jgi:hypothetical protein
LSGGSVDPEDPHAATSGNTFYRGLSDKETRRSDRRIQTTGGEYYRIFNLIFKEKV